MSRVVKGVSLYDDSEAEAFRFAKELLEESLGEAVTDGQALKAFADSFVVSRGQFRPSLLDDALEAVGTESQDADPTLSAPPNSDGRKVMRGRLSEKPETISVSELHRGDAHGD